MDIKHFPIYTRATVTAGDTIETSFILLPVVALLLIIIGVLGYQRRDYNGLKLNFINPIHNNN
jgi:MprA protease rhombosortase-interaction domain-containing protein